MSEMPDLRAYLARIGVAVRPTPDLPSLRGLHLGHVTHIPFENLDIQMGLPIRLDLGSLEAKLVTRRRGGYCFEQNTLFLRVLQAVGFNPFPCEARVRSDETRISPRTHMVLVTPIDGQCWLSDVGFGGLGLLEPVAMDGREDRQGDHTYRVATVGELRALQARHADGWKDLYVFVPEARHPIDFEVANWFTSTHPESLFVKTLTAQQATPAARHVLRGLSYTVSRGEVAETVEIRRDALVPLLRETFGLDVPDDARFRGLDGAPRGVEGPPVR